MLLTGDGDSDVCEKYPELTDQSFAVQLSMFKNTYHVNSLSDASAIFKKMVPEVRRLFVAVEQLIRLMLVSCMPCFVMHCRAVVQRASQTENLASQLND